jgi:hypothetical protein
VFCFPRLDQSVIKLLAGRNGIALTGQLFALAGERDDFNPLDRTRPPVSPSVDDVDRSEPSLLEEPQIAAHGPFISAIQRLRRILQGHDTKASGLPQERLFFGVETDTRQSRLQMMAAPHMTLTW